ncbi:HrcA family transcriptional regulator [Helicobacter anatolicus]|uniref:HrcA family transcriptional regulator n=1 Tax=Helicobacter anatolicus TaxID=2905874 RepID=UPI001E2FD772|nr:HrcA family transcriptional regulator [Helicobacter anatolicus]MCE3039535.1 HrcA family transcriptional regulator [Helicobacter anatolicus]
MGYSKEILLEQFIQEYIRLKEPIGSEMLKNSLELKISSATIRNYFKALMDEGILIQPHISSGRIPTHFAMKNYWRQKININKNFKILDDKQLLHQICKKHQIFLLLKEDISQKLTQVLNIENNFLILVFEKGKILLDYQARMEKFLQELIGLDIQEIKKIAYQVMANTLLKKINYLQNDKVTYFALEVLDSFISYPYYQDLFFDIIKGDIFDKCANGILFDPIFPENYMGILHDGLQQEKNIKILCVGYLTADYETFYEQIAA